VIDNENLTDSSEKVMLQLDQVYGCGEIPLIDSNRSIDHMPAVFERQGSPGSPSGLLGRSESNRPLLSKIYHFKGDN
jgi:hypothetical protein